MLARLTLTDRTNALRAFGKATQIAASLVRAACPKPWVADVTEGRRVFLPGKTDYVHANGDGSKGVEVSFILWPGRVYEVCEPDPPGPALRYRAEVINGLIVRTQKTCALKQTVL